MKQIIFYAPLGRGVPVEKIGGAEAGCLKTKQIYEDAGFEVIPVDKPAISRGKLRFLIEMALLPLKMLIVLRKHRKAVLHIVGFYTKIARYEWLLMMLGRWTGHRVVYELRNGSMVRTYEEGTNCYRKVLKDLLLKSDVVLCQGMEYMDFIRQQWGVERNYYPNYIMDDFLQPNNLNRPKPVKLIYFGRVTESKNVDVVIKVLALVRNAGIEAGLDIIGGYNEQYKAVLDNITQEERVAEHVIFYGRKPFDFIAEKLRLSHYFVFPSSEKQEGHSNSLTEAMGCGVVPIVSTAGFNRSICGMDTLVVDNLDANSFAHVIINIEQNDKWRYYSDKVYSRITDNFTQRIVSKNLVECISKLMV